MRVRLIEQSDINECINFQALDGKRRTFDQWAWEFLTFDRVCPPFVIVEDNDRVLGTQALIPIRMIDREGIYWSAKSEETLLDPSLRGKNMFKAMYDVLFEYAEKQDFAVIWGFTPATRAFEKLAFEVPCKTTQLFLPFSPASLDIILPSVVNSGRLKKVAYRTALRLAGLLSRAKLGIAPTKCRNLKKDLLIKTLEASPQEAGQLCRQFIKQWGGTTIFRDEAYLKWRIFDNPYIKPVVRGSFYKGNLIGWIAYTIDENSMGYIVDIFLSSELLDQTQLSYVLKEMIRDAAIRMRKCGALGIRAWHLNNHPFDQAVLRAACSVGFFHIKRGESVVFRLMDAGAERVALKSFDNWYVNRIFTEGDLG